MEFMQVLIVATTALMVAHFLTVVISRIER